MSRIVRLCACYGLISICLSPLAFAETIDFEVLSENDASSHVVGHSYVEKGYRFFYDSSQPGLLVYGSLHPDYAGSTALIANGGFGNRLYLRRSDNQAFSVNTIDLVRADFGNFANQSITFYGRIPVTREIVRQTVQVSGSLNVPATYVLSDEFNRVVELQIPLGGAPNVQLDNIQVELYEASIDEQIPIPPFALYALFVLLGWVGITYSKD